MQDLSFYFDNPIFSFQQFSLSIQIFTYENVYGLDEENIELTENKGKLTVKAGKLTWAGGQEKCTGQCVCIVSQNNKSGAIQIDINAKLPYKIRSVKVKIHNIDRTGIFEISDLYQDTTPDEGIILNYPEGWRELTTPLVVFQRNNQEQYLYVRSLDNTVNEKRIILLPKGEKMDVELIWEEDATRQGNQIIVPPWEIGFTNTPEEIFEQHTNFIESVYGLERWEKRTDVPDWAKKISLIVTIHMQHYTGYIFNTYAEALEVVNWFAERFPAENTLFYLPGWEGRYYWEYGDYSTNARMGGKEGFSQLISGIHQLGANCMPMFGLNIVNKSILNYEQWGQPAQRIEASGNVSKGSVDWDGSRDYDLGWGAMVNPGAPTWQNRLVNQILELKSQFGFRAAFLDISASWWNDPRFNVYEGTKQLINRLQDEDPDFLIAGEGWYDAMSKLTPLIQCGHTRGEMNWPDNPYEPAFEKYCRSFGHLSMGDPGRFSTGVHELGTNPTWQTPLRKSIIPTVAIVDGSIENGEESIEVIISQAKQYLHKYLLTE